MNANTVMLGAIRTPERQKAASPQPIARLAGLIYIVIAIAAGVAHFYVPSTLIVPNDAAATASNILASESLLRYGAIGSELIILLSEVVLTILLYVLLKPVDKTLSLLAAVTRLVMTTIHGINLLNYGFALMLLGGADYLTVFQPDQLQALALFFLNAHEYGFTIGIVFFTLHVFVLAWLIFRSEFIPRIFGVLFFIAAVGYFITSGSELLVANYVTPDTWAMIIAVSEVVFPLWLLIRGVHVERWQQAQAVK